MRRSRSRKRNEKEPMTQDRDIPLRTPVPRTAINLKYSRQSLGNLGCALVVTLGFVAEPGNGKDLEKEFLRTMSHNLKMLNECLQERKE